MKASMRFLPCIPTLLFLLCSFNVAGPGIKDDPLTGSWTWQHGDEQQVLLFIDGYHTQTTYNTTLKKFAETRGGPYEISGNALTIMCEFDTRDRERTGQLQPFSFSIKGKTLTIKSGAKTREYNRVDDGTASLAGLWTISSRMEDGKIVPIHRTGTRKTIKMLSGTRFQWAAIDPGQKQFLGTGGGTYEFANGKYTEHIQFFSRDSTRVGAALTFDGKLEKGDWHHSGLSSKGDKIYEIWSRVKNL